MIRLKNNICYLLLIFNFIFLISCKKEKETEKKQIIPSELKNYVDSFFIAGRDRGIQNFYLENYELEISYQKIEGGYAGWSTGEGEIYIDNEQFQPLSHQEKKALVFHELGHEILKRKHKEDVDQNNMSLSLMRYTFERNTNIYSNLWWEYYIDELFDSSTKLPSWYTEFENFNTFEIDSLVLDTLSSIYFQTNAINIKDLNKIEINYEVYNALSSEEDIDEINLGNIKYFIKSLQRGVDILSNLDGKYLYTTSEYYFPIFYPVNNTLKITIRKVNGILYFYLNEKLIHGFEENLWDGNNLIEVPSGWGRSWRLSINTLK